MISTKSRKTARRLAAPRLGDLGIVGQQAHDRRARDQQLEAAEDVELVCADILDPPFPPGSFDLIVALNLLDNVTDPLALLNQLNLQLRPGGLLLLSSPFAWHERITPRDKRLAFAVPHARMEDRMLLEKLLTGAIPLGYGPPMTFRSLATDRLTWHLRVHDTHYQTYLPPLALWRKDG